MDKDDFVTIANPIIQNSLKRAKELAKAYYESDEYLNHTLGNRPPTNVEEHRDAAKKAILSLNKLATSLHPKKKGLPIAPEPISMLNLEDENRKLMFDIRSIKDRLVFHLCHLYGITPPEHDHYFRTEGEALRNLVVFLAADKLNEPLKKRPRGRSQKPPIVKEYHEQRELAFAAIIDEIKLKLKDKTSDKAIIETVIKYAEEQTPFGKQCLGFRNFYIRVKGSGYEISSIKNRLSKARKQNKERT